MSNCSQNYFYEVAIGVCTSCDNLCVPEQGRMKLCKDSCPDYYRRNAAKLLPRKALCHGQDNYSPICTSCATICDRSNGLSFNCQNSCPDYVRSHYGIVLDSVTGGNSHGNDLYWGLGVLFLAGLLLTAVIGVVVLAVKLRRRHCHHSKHGCSPTPEIAFPLHALQPDRRDDSDSGSGLHPSIGLLQDSSYIQDDRVTLSSSSFQTERPHQLTHVNDASVLSIDLENETALKLGNVEPQENVPNILRVFSDSHVTICKEVEQTHEEDQSSQREFHQLQGNHITGNLDNLPHVRVLEPNDDRLDHETTNCNDVTIAPDPDVTVCKECFTHSSSTCDDMEISRLSPNLQTSSGMSSPVVSLRLSAGDVRVESERDIYFVWDVLSQPNAYYEHLEGSSEDGYAISTADCDYLQKQNWVRIWMRSGGKMEIVVDGISLEEAKRNILENTGLHWSRVFVTTFMSATFQHLNGDGTAIGFCKFVHFWGKQASNPEKVPMCSTVGGCLNNGTNALLYIITSAHNSSVGTDYYSDPRMRPEDHIGMCRYCFCDDQLDIAFIRVEPIPDDQLTNHLSLPREPSGTPMEFMPQLFQQDLASLADQSVALLKHSKSLVRGKFAEIVEDGKVQNALIGQMSHSDACHPGDSGSLVTYLPGELGSQGQQLLSVLGIVTGLKTLTRKIENMHFITKACIFTPLWPALQLMAHMRGEDPTSYRFCLAMASQSKAPLTMLTKDSGYANTATPLTVHHKQRTSSNS